MDRYVRIYKESDFDFQYKLDDAHLSTLFKFIFFTVDINENFTCSFDGTEYIHCTRESEDEIVFHIDGNTFSCGNLRIRKEYFIDSASFDDNICNSVDVEKTNIYIIEEGSNACSVVYEGSTLPNFDAMLIEQNVEKAMIELSQMEDSVETEMTYIIQTKDEMNNMLEEAAQWEDRIETIENNYITQSDLNNALDGYVTDTELQSQLDEYATESYVQSKIDNIPTVDLIGYATEAYVVDYVATYAPQPDLTNYVTQNDLSNASYATQSYVQDKINEIPGVDLSDYPTYAYTDANYVTYTYLAETVDDIVAGTVDLTDYVKKNELESMSYATQAYVQDKIDNIPSVDLSAYITNDELSQELASYVTKTELSNAGYISSIPSEYITQTELSANSYLTQHQDLSNYVTKTGLDQTLVSYVTKNDLDNASYATKSYVVDYVSEHGGGSTPDMSAYVTKVELNNAGYISSIPSEYITQAELSSNSYLTQHQSLDNYVTKTQLNNAGYLTSVPSEYVTQAELSSNSYLTQHQSLDNYVTKTQLNNASYVSQQTLSNNSYATQSYVIDKVNAIQPVTYETTYETTYENISIWQGTYAMYQLLPDYTTYQLYLIQQE